MRYDCEYLCKWRRSKSSLNVNRAYKQHVEKIRHKNENNRSSGDGSSSNSIDSNRTRDNIHCVVSNNRSNDDDDDYLLNLFSVVVMIITICCCCRCCLFLFVLFNLLFMLCVLHCCLYKLTKVIHWAELLIILNWIMIVMNDCGFCRSCRCRRRFFYLLRRILTQSHIYKWTKIGSS